jgi:hypothetical protein
MKVLIDNEPAAASLRQSEIQQGDQSWGRPWAQYLRLFDGVPHKQEKAVI